MGSTARATTTRAERRQFPRVSVALPVVLKRSKGKKVHGLVHNVSPGGMQVRLSTKSTATLLPKRKEIRGKADCSVHAQLVVPVRKERVAIKVKARIVHISPVLAAPEEARIAIGFRFERFSNKRSLRRFVMFLEEHMVPLEDHDLYLNGKRSRRIKTKIAKKATA